MNYSKWLSKNTGSWKCVTWADLFIEKKQPFTGMRKFRIDQDFLIEQWQMIYIMSVVFAEIYVWMKLKHNFRYKISINRLVSIDILLFKAFNKSCHIGIQGNETVDKQAKISLSLEPTSFKIPFSNSKPSINKYILEEWQTSWNNSIGNKLLDIKPTIGEYQSVVRNIRKEEVVLARLHLSHTRVTHSYLLLGEEQPQCVGLRCTIHCTSLPFGVWRFCTSKK